jgi:hypothetical protein
MLVPHCDERTLQRQTDPVGDLDGQVDTLFITDPTRNMRNAFSPHNAIAFQFTPLTGPARRSHGAAATEQPGTPFALLHMPAPVWAANHPRISFALEVGHEQGPG